MQIKTIRSLLCATEETREYLWNLFVSYSLLINQLLERLPREPEFANWRKLGRIPRKAIVAVYGKVLEEDGSLKGLPTRFYTSAVLSTGYTFASIFAIQNKLRARIEGKQRWLSVAEHDLELAETTDFSPETLREVAAQVVEQAEAERQREFDARKNRSGQPLPLMSVLFQLWDKTKDPLRCRAIAHLLRNDCQVSLEEEDPEKLALRLSKKRIQIERLQEQLDSQLPIGRDPLGDRAEKFLKEAIAVEADPEEFEAWERSLSEHMANLSTQLKTLPYPLLFGSTDDLYWSWEPEQQSEITRPASAHTQTSADPSTRRKPKRCRTRQRKKRLTRRISVSFKGKGLSHLRLRLYCDRRQLPIFRQLVEDSEANKAREKKDKFSLALSPLRSASLLWVENPHASGDQSLPWQTHRLCLHATIDPRLLTAEGTEAVREEKITLMNKFLKGLEDADEVQVEEQLSEAEQAELLTAEKNRTIATKRNQTTLTRLQSNSPPPRPSRVAYQGNPDLVVKVAFSREQIVGVAVSDGFQPVLDYRDAESLLVDLHVELLEQRSLKLRNQPERLRKAKSNAQKTKAPRPKRTRYKPKISTRQLQLQPYRLLKRWRRLKRKNLSERQVEQKHGLYRQSQAESNLAQYINRLLARNIVDLCQRWSAGLIILPEFGDVRESIESEIQAKAKRKYPDDDVERQKQYAKEFRMTFHRWNYKHLSECIRIRAAKAGITCVAGQQPRLGTLREKAIAVTAIPPKPK